MRKLSIFLLIGVVVVLAWPVAASAGVEAVEKAEAFLKCDPTEPCVTDLIAGQNFTVGIVRVTWLADSVKVEYQITDADWYITEVHLWAGSDVPDKSAPGKFPYKDEDLWTQHYTFIIPLPADDGCSFAAHAVVKKIIGEEANLPGFEEALPGQVTMWVQHPGGDSYFNVMVNGGTALEGVYDNWCVDTSHTIGTGPGNIYTADVYSSYEDLPGGLFPGQEDMDLVNWIINQDFVGQAGGTSCGRAYFYGDVQAAIWSVLGQSNGSGLGTWSAACRDEIVDAAMANGEGFVPICGDFIAVILVPVDGRQVTIAQVTAAAVEVPCIPIYESETAWGNGDRFGRGWAMYFECCPQP